MSSHATLEVPRRHPAFEGHFPGFPVLPGAALLDAALEIVRRAHGLDTHGWQISAKFLGTVQPGEILDIEHEAPRADLVRFTIRSGERPVASGTLARRPSAAPEGSRGPYLVSRAP